MADANVKCIIDWYLTASRAERARVARERLRILHQRADRGEHVSETEWSLAYAIMPDRLERPRLSVVGGGKPPA